MRRKRTPGEGEESGEKTQKHAKEVNKNTVLTCIVQFVDEIVGGPLFPVRQQAFSSLFFSALLPFFEGHEVGGASVVSSLPLLCKLVDLGQYLQAKNSRRKMRGGRGESTKIRA